MQFNKFLDCWEKVQPRQRQPKVQPFKGSTRLNDLKVQVWLVIKVCNSSSYFQIPECFVLCLFFPVKKLEEELSVHQETVKSVQKSGSNKGPVDGFHGGSSPGDEDPELAALRAKWEELVQQEADRKRKLDANLEYIRPRVSWHIVVTMVNIYYGITCILIEK